MVDAILVPCVKLPSGKVMPDRPRDTDNEIGCIVSRRYTGSKPELSAGFHP